MSQLDSDLRSERPGLLFYHCTVGTHSCSCSLNTQGPSCLISWSLWFSCAAKFQCVCDVDEELGHAGPTANVKYMPWRGLISTCWRCWEKHGKQTTLECCTLLAYLGQPCPAVDLNMHDYPSLPCSTAPVSRHRHFQKQNTHASNLNMLPQSPVIDNKYIPIKRTL